MEYSFTPEQEAFRQEIQEFCQKEITPEIRGYAAAVQGPGDIMNHIPEFYRKVAQRGWLGMGWPKEYGGQGRDYMDMMLFAEEMGYWGAPMGLYGSSVVFVGNAIIHFGSEQQKREILPRIASGELAIALGYTEPNAGTDLASLQLRAVADGDDYVLNGQKVFTTGAQHADHIIMATRTDPNVPKHRGITLFLIPMSTPGITIRPLWTTGHGRTNETFFEDVRVPRETMLGELNRGWYHLATALDFERVGIGSAVGSMQHLLERVVAFVKEPGNPVRNNSIFRHAVAETAIELDVLRNMCYRIAWMQNRGMVPSVEGSANKIYATELSVRMAQRLMRMLSEFGLLEGEEAHHRLPLADEVSNLYLATSAITALAGSTEIQLGIIAQRGLGLPRSN